MLHISMNIDVISAKNSQKTVEINIKKTKKARKNAVNRIMQKMNNYKNPINNRILP